MEGKGECTLMVNTFSRIFGLVLCLLSFAGCAATQTNPPGPPPPQNLIGSTDELQLVAELSLNLAEEYGGEQILVVLEIDGTLLSMKPHQQGNPCGPSSMHAGASMMQPAQANVAELVKRIQAAGLNVIVLTSRAPDCSQNTFADLDSYGFNFATTAWPPRDGYPEPFLPKGGDRPVLYENGVFFAAGQDKGVMLKALLEKTSDPQPVIIVMADSSRENLNAVMKVFSWSGTKIHAWRYTREQSVAPGP
jgi:hypothetical protein